MGNIFFQTQVICSGKHLDSLPLTEETIRWKGAYGECTWNNIRGVYTPRTLPVFSLYTVQGVYRESTGSVRGVYRECTGSIECALSIYGHMCNAQSRRGILSEAICTMCTSSWNATYYREYWAHICKCMKVIELQCVVLHWWGWSLASCNWHHAALLCSTP